MSAEIQLGLPGPLPFAEIFGNENPLEIELGYGKALFLIRSAQARPEVNFLGLEVSRKWYREGKRRVEKAGSPPNLRILHAEAVDFLTRFVGDGAVSVLHVYYPDPWPKARHQKRRFVAEPLLVQAERVLAPGGELRIATDHEDYRDWIAERLEGRERLTLIDWPLEDEPLTHFEAKYRKQGRGAYRFRLRLESS